MIQYKENGIIISFLKEKYIEFVYSCVFIPAIAYVWGNTPGVFKFILMIFVATGFYTIHLFKENKKYKSQEIKALSFQDLCIQINAILDENNTLFREFSPNGGNAVSSEKLKNENDLILWEEIKNNYIAINNKSILSLINENENLLSAKNKELFNKMKFHIIAFERHLIDKNYDYFSKYPFPSEFSDFIKKYCGYINAKEIENISKWLNKKLKNNEIKEIHLHGSILQNYYSKINDIDVIIYSNQKASLENAKFLTSIKKDCKKKFKKELHISFFSRNENHLYQEFRNKLNGKKRIK